jgi:hypothetical protein
MATAQARCGRRDSMIPVKNRPRHCNLVDTIDLCLVVAGEKGIDLCSRDKDSFCDISSLRSSPLGILGILLCGHDVRILTDSRDGTINLAGRREKAFEEMQDKSIPLPQQRTRVKHRMAPLQR